MTKETLKQIGEYCNKRGDLYVKLSELKGKLLDAEIDMLERPGIESKTAFRLLELKVLKAENALKLIKCPVDANDYELGECWDLDNGITIEVRKYFKSKFFKLHRE